MNKENIQRSVEILCKHLSRLNDDIEREGLTCSAQVYDLSKTLHGLKSAHCILSKLV